MTMKGICVYEEDWADIWASGTAFRKHLPIVYPLSDTLPGLYVLVIFTVLHFLFDYISATKAKMYALKKVKIREPAIFKQPTSALVSQLHATLKKSIQSKKQLQKLLGLQRNGHDNNNGNDRGEYASIFADTETETGTSDVNNVDPKLNLKRKVFEYGLSLIAYHKHISKFQESLFKVICFGSVYVFGLYLVYVEGHEFFWDQKRMWAQGVPQPFSETMRVWYALQVGYHGHRAVYQLFEHKRRDFVAMLIHHWVTCLLLVGSWMVSYPQIGATVLLCNDNLDLFMPLAKLCEYIGYTKLNLLFTALFVVLWIPMRIFVYFYKVIYSIACDGHYQIREYYEPYFFLIGLTVIYLLQVYWTKFLLQMLYRKIFKGQAVTDTRSDDENDASAVIGDTDGQKKLQ